MCRTALFLSLVLCSSFAAGQRLYLNNGVDTIEPGVKAAIHFLQTYLDAFDTTSNPNYSNYWPEEDCKNLKHPDPIVFAIAGDYPTYRMGSTRTVLYVKPDTNYIQIKTLFAWTDTQNTVSVLAITNHYIKADNHAQLKFISPLKVIGGQWQTQTVRNVTYTYPSKHVFNKSKADSLVLSIEKLEREWDLKPISIHYYFADTKDEIQKLRGFDYSLDMGNRDKPSGISDDQDNVVFCSGLDENYFHEVVHIYLNHLYPKSPLREGLAIFYGGSMGHNLQWHTQRLSAYLQAHTEINLDSLDKKNYFIYVDNYTNPAGTIRGLICALVYKKSGIEGLKRMMTYTTLEEIFNKEFGLKRGQWDKFLRDATTSY